MGTLTGFSTSIGFVVASAVGLPTLLGNDEYWHWAYLLGSLLNFILKMFRNYTFVFTCICYVDIFV